MIKPFKSFLLLIYVALILGVVTYFLPTETVLGNNISFHSFKFQDIFFKEKIEYANIESIQKKFNAPDISNLSDSVNQDTVARITEDTIPNIEVTDDFQRPSHLKEVFGDSLEARYRIFYPKDQDTLLYAFFRSLKKTNKYLIRVLHYGDSQIEGDRITAPLRFKFQERFGGCGAGMLPLLDPLGNRTSVIEKSDGSWIRYKAFGPDFSRKVANRHGILGSYFKYRFSYPVKDTTEREENDTTPRKPIYITKKWVNASINLYRSSLAYPRENHYQSIKILYRNTESDFDLSLKNGKDSLENRHFDRDTLSIFNIYEHLSNENFSKIKITFGSKKSPEFYGIALDCKNGIAMDNMPFRGSSGVEFTRMNLELLREQIKRLNIKLIILQFGVNVVPYVTSDYGFYENQFYNQLKMFKNIAPNVSVLVVGVSDMSRKQEGEYVSYPNVEKIRNSQRKAAFRAGCAFWDLYDAMGGKNSMPSWVFAKPALANKDFTHFTYRGATLVAEMLYKSIMSEYEKFNTLQ